MRSNNEKIGQCPYCGDNLTSGHKCTRAKCEIENSIKKIAGYDDLKIENEKLKEALQDTLNLVCEGCISKNPHHKDCTSCNDTDYIRDLLKD